jgi:hypothetical protein
VLSVQSLRRLAMGSARWRGRGPSEVDEDRSRALPPSLCYLLGLLVDAVVAMSSQAVVFAGDGLQTIAVRNVDVSALILDESQPVEGERTFSD